MSTYILEVEAGAALAFADQVPKKHGGCGAHTEPIVLLVIVGKKVVFPSSAFLRAVNQNNP